MYTNQINDLQRDIDIINETIRRLNTGERTNAASMSNASVREWCRGVVQKAARLLPPIAEIENSGRVDPLGVVRVVKPSTTWSAAEEHGRMVAALRQYKLEVEYVD